MRVIVERKSFLISLIDINYMYNLIRDPVTDFPWIYNNKSFPQTVQYLLTVRSRRVTLSCVCMQSVEGSKYLKWELLVVKSDMFIIDQCVGSALSYVATTIRRPFCLSTVQCTLLAFYTLEFFESFTFFNIFFWSINFSFAILANQFFPLLNLPD